MASPFPGMDPYLEHPARWPGVHNALIAELARRLGPLLRPRLDDVYETGAYDLRIDDRADAVPPLEGADAAWADELLRARGLR